MIVTLILKLILVLLPLFFWGFVVLKLFTKENRAEIVLPVSFILGTTHYIFLLNLLSFILNPKAAILVAYLLLIILEILLFKIYLRSYHKEIILDFGSFKSLFLWLSSVIIWGAFIFWKAAYALIGADAKIYYSIASSFLRGNVPFLTPWQPDTPLAYHVGSSELLATLHFLTGLSYEFLHMFLSAIFVLCSIQIVIWVLDRHKDIFPFFLSNIAAAVTFISLGLMKIVLPNIPLVLPAFNGPKDILVWLRNLPAGQNAIESYGVPVNLDGLIYTLFNAHGIAVFLSLTVLLLNLRGRYLFQILVILLSGLAALSLINEVFFGSSIVVFTIIFSIFLLRANKRKFKIHLMKKLLVPAVGLIFALTIIFQGGVISGAFLHKNIDSSVILLPFIKGPKAEQIRDYHQNSEITRFLGLQEEWFPFRWYNFGLDLLFILTLLIIFRLQLTPREKKFYLILFITATFSLLAYDMIIPIYVTANGNRILITSYIALSIIVISALNPLMRQLRSRGKWIGQVLIALLLIFIFCPTLIPPLAQLSRNRFGQNKMIPKIETREEIVKWIDNNIPPKARITVLDGRTPHPSGVTQVLVDTGIFTPVFSGGFRTYNIEPGPEYTDIAYTLSPQAFKKLGITFFMIDSNYYSTMLPKVRKEQLDQGSYFKKVFEDSSTKEWKRVYKISNVYLEKGGELVGTLDELNKIAPLKGKYYIDNEENFEPNFLRRPLIFILRGRDLYFTHGSGVYQHVETVLLYREPEQSGAYDYLVLGKSTNPEKICHCEPLLVWTGLDGGAYFWRTNLSN